MKQFRTFLSLLRLAGDGQPAADDPGGLGTTAQRFHSGGKKPVHLRRSGSRGWQLSIAPDGELIWRARVAALPDGNRRAFCLSNKLRRPQVVSFFFIKKWKLHFWFMRNAQAVLRALP